MLLETAQLLAIVWLHARMTRESKKALRLSSKAVRADVDERVRFVAMWLGRHKFNDEEGPIVDLRTEADTPQDVVAACRRWPRLRTLMLSTVPAVRAVFSETEGATLLPELDGLSIFLVRRCMRMPYSGQRAARERSRHEPKRTHTHMRRRRLAPSPTCTRSPCGRAMCSRR
jgi:hypothetical protein